VNRNGPSPAPAGRPTLIIFDPTLRSLEGHSSNYDLAVAALAASHFDQVVVFSDPSYRPDRTAVPVRAIAEPVPVRTLRALVRSFHALRDTAALPNSVSRRTPAAIRRVWWRVRAYGFVTALERALAAVAAPNAPAIHVLVQQVDLPELVAADRWLRRSPWRRAAAGRLVLHLVLRHDPEITRAGLETVACFAARLRRIAHGTDRTRVALHTDSERIARAYRELLDRPDLIGVLPIPVPEYARVVAQRRQKHASDLLRLSVLGTARIERGFGTLTNLIRRLPANVGGRPIEFAVQVSRRSHDPRVLSTVRWLDDYRASRPRSGPSLQLLEGPVPAAEYFGWFERTDLLIAPHVSPKYLSSTSGVFVEALHCGIPSLVLAGTWAAGIVEDAGRQGYGIGCVASNIEELPQAVLEACRRLPEYTRDIGAYTARHLAGAARAYPQQLLAAGASADG
jgi:glycosyltransferase involved in cell wall biosynthesis